MKGEKSQRQWIIGFNLTDKNKIVCMIFWLPVQLGKAKETLVMRQLKKLCLKSYLAGDGAREKHRMHFYDSNGAV